MTIVRALMAVLWLLFGMTATAHATTVATPAPQPPCHMTGDVPHKLPPAPARDQGLMPCCSQPVVIAPAEILVPFAVHIERVSLTPAPALPLTSIVIPYEPHPPKTA